MTKDLSFVTDTHGRFYAGMTLNEAKRNGTDKSFFHRDFHNLDKNKDEFLSVQEILDERKRSSNIDKWTVGLFGVWGVVDMLTARGSASWMMLDLMIDGFIVISSAMSAYKTDKGTQRIEKRLQEMAENRLQLNV